MIFITLNLHLHRLLQLSTVLLQFKFFWFLECFNLVIRYAWLHYWFNHSWLLGVSRELRLITWWVAFASLSVVVLEFKGVSFCAKQAQLYCCGINITLLFCHLDLFYVGVNSIILYTLWYYNIYAMK